MLRNILVALVLATAVLAQHHKHDPCRTCEFLLNMAEHHFHRNITDETALKAQLLTECQNLAKFEGQDAATACTNLVNTKMDVIYNDIKKGDRNSQTCVDLGECKPRVEEPVILAPHDPCRTCDLLMNIAEHHFKNNIKDEAALKTQLNEECVRLGQHEGKQAAQHCASLVANNIDTIFKDLSAGKRPHQTCVDLKECVKITMRAQRV